jgi:hypothetical protein
VDSQVPGRGLSWGVLGSRKDSRLAGCERWIVAVDKMVLVWWTWTLGQNENLKMHRMHRNLALSVYVAVVVVVGHGFGFGTVECCVG